MDISACPSCASRRMRDPGIGDGSILGLATVGAVCPECGFQGSPLLFDDEEAFEAFRDDVGHDREDAHDDHDVANERDARDHGREDGARRGTEVADDTPDWVRDELDATGPRRGSPATAVLIGGIGLVALATGALFSLGGLATIVTGGATAVRVVMSLGFLVQVLVSLALLRIAVRLWRGGAPAGPRGVLPP